MGGIRCIELRYFSNFIYNSTQNYLLILLVDRQHFKIDKIYMKFESKFKQENR